MYALKLLRQLIEMENLGSTASAMEWDDWSKYREVSVCVLVFLWFVVVFRVYVLSQRVVLVQEELARLGLVPVLVRLVGESTDEPVIEEALNLCAAMLIGGNSKVRLF